MTRVAVVGPGAMGCLFAARLALGGHDVGIICRSQSLAEALAAEGLTIERDGQEQRARVWVARVGEHVELVELVLVLVKSFDTTSAAHAAEPLLAPDGVVATFQNGLGNAEQLADVLGSRRVLGGVTSQGATLLGPGRVRHAGFGRSHVAEMQGGAGPRASALALLLSNAGIPTQAEERLEALVWGKLVTNVAINPLTALTGLRNGELLDSAHTSTLVDDLAREAAAVAHAAGVSLPFSDAAEHARRTAEITRANRSSMLQDVSRERRTEIDAINGAVLRLAEVHGVPAPTNAAVYRLVKGLERRYLGDS